MSNRTYYVVLAILAAVLLLVSASGCKKTNTNKETTGAVEEQTKSTEKTEVLSGTLRIGGSTTILPLAQAASEQFMAKNPEVRVEIQGTGSSEGIKGVSDGSLDIGDSSRELKDEEKNLGLVDHQVATDVLAFVVNPDNKIAGLSKPQIIDILTGKVTNWKYVGGTDAKIQVIGRDEASGTREFVQKEVIGADARFVVDALALPGTGQLKAAVAQTPNGFGYMSIGQVDDTVKSVTVDGVKASPDTVADKSYPFSRSLHMFTKGEPNDLEQAFLDFVLSDEFQQETVAKEFYSVNE